MTTAPPQWPQPAWLADIDDPAERETARIQILLGYACTYHSQKGTAATLAETLGLSPNAFALVKMRGSVTAELAKQLELALGREAFPRELWRPDIFVVD